MESSLSKSLKENGCLIKEIEGASMYPYLRCKLDKVVILPVEGKIIKPLDIVLFNYEDNLVLHRVIKIDGDLVFTRGDNTDSFEMIKREDVIGILSTVIRNGKHKKFKRNYFAYKFNRLIRKITK